MPCNYDDYPANWKTEIRARILERAYGHCEFCGVPNYAIILRHNKNNAIYRVLRAKTVEGALDDMESAKHKHPGCIIEFGMWRRPIRIVLTIAHLDHDTAHNDDSNLAALCQRCHLRHDRNQHAATRARNQNHDR